MRSRDVDARRASERLAAAMARAAEASGTAAPTGWVPRAPGPDPEQAPGGPGERDVERDETEDLPPRARWAVSAAAALALLVIAALLTLAWGVRTASGAPGVPVPDRTTRDAAPASDAAAADPAAADSSAPDAVEATDAADGAGGRGGGADVAGPAGESTPGASGAAAVVPGPDRQAAARLPAGELVVHVVGQVHDPGLARLPVGARVADAVDAAGGATDDADLPRVNLARPLVDGEQVLVPRPGEEVPPAPAPDAAGSTGADAGGGGPDAADVPVDLNAATAADLDALPGLGPVLSARVVEFRDRIGRFSVVDELGEVSGIGDVLLERLRPLVRV